MAKGILKTLKYHPAFRPLWTLLSYPSGGVIFCYFYLKAITSTIEVRSEIAGPGATYSGPAIYVNWHEFIPHLVHEHGKHHRWVLVSNAPYMEPIARWCRFSGLNLIRGGSGENGQATLEQMKARLLSGGSLMIAVDGPAGPPHHLKRGCIELARETHFPIIPVAYRSSRGHRWTWRWDQALVPSFFDSIVVHYGEPLFISDQSVEESPEQLPVQLKDAHSRVTAALNRVSGMTL